MTIWTKEQLFEVVSSHLPVHRFITVSNCEPYIPMRTGGRVACMRPASGMAAAPDPILRESDGLWVAHGSGNADAITVDDNTRVAAPPEAPDAIYHSLPMTLEGRQDRTRRLRSQASQPRRANMVSAA